EWDFDGDGVYDWNSPTTGDTVHHYTEAGSYKAVLRVTDDSGNKDVSVVDVSVSHGLSVSLSTDSFDPILGESVSIDSVLAGEAKVTVRIIDRAGNIVRTLAENALRPAGYYADIWNGKNDQAQTVNAGVYLYIIEYTAGGKAYVYDITGNVDPNRYTPVVTYPPDFSPFDYETNFFRYTLDRKSEVTVYISYLGAYEDQRVKTLFLRKPQKAGNYVLVWDGTDDDGDLVEPTAYVIAVFCWKLPDNAIIVNTEPMVSDLVASPAYFNPFFNPYTETTNATFTYSLSKAADVTATVYNSANFIVKTITVNNVPSGIGNKITWNGKNERDEYVDAGNYRFKLIATDANGNRSREANTLFFIFY
ncbi:FlgD immunoglobulin-like domain containing protein, partial [Thermodesulfobacteriota bacterium]